MTRPVGAEGQTAGSSGSIIDFHTHILPGIDDGSRDIETTRRMLEQSASQGIRTVLATPHFYAYQSSLEHFLERRNHSLDSVHAIAGDCGITVLPGAEVAFFSGIGRSGQLTRLTIADTSLILLEMPFRPWTDDDIREVCSLTRSGIQPVIAHIERFYSCQRDKRMIEKLLSLPVYVQVNAEALLTWRTRKLALQIFRDGKAHLLGSDCHNISSRPPNLAEGRDVIRKRLGGDCLGRIDSLGQELLASCPTKGEESLTKRVPPLE